MKITNYFHEVNGRRRVEKWAEINGIGRVKNKSMAELIKEIDNHQEKGQC
jgi:predicted DNA-binding ribbon-helix-helix protein